MKADKSTREKILNQPQYWVEAINGYLYNAIAEFMEANSMNRTQLAEHLGITKGRVSQILNDGEVNFSIEKIVEMALKIGKFPVFELEDKSNYLEQEKSNVVDFKISYNSFQFVPVPKLEQSKDSKVVPIHKNFTQDFKFANY